MLQLTPQLRILIAREPVDFRSGIDALASFCRRELEEDPFSGAVFVFRNRAATSLRILSYDGQGFWLCTKRWSKGRLAWWPAPGERRLHPVAAQELAVLLYNGDPTRARFAPDWRKVG
jgi:transposase